jgi:hypothetical protein
MGGDKVQEVVEEKSGVGDIRSAAVINIGAPLRYRLFDPGVTVATQGPTACLTGVGDARRRWCEITCSVRRNPLLLPDDLQRTPPPVNIDYRMNSPVQNVWGNQRVAQLSG